VTTPATRPRTFVQRIAGATALQSAVYEEVEGDRGAMAQAVVVVIAASIAAGIGLGGLSGRGLAGIPLQAAASLAAWVAWAMLTLQIGTRLLPERQTRASMGELLRTLGFAASPGLLGVLALLPGLAAPVFALTSIWMLLAMVVAVRSALDYSSVARALAVCLVAALLVVGMALLVGVLFQTRVS
jgi:hypothetical protein